MEVINALNWTEDLAFDSIVYCAAVGHDGSVIEFNRNLITLPFVTTDTYLELSFIIKKGFDTFLEKVSQIHTEHDISIICGNDQGARLQVSLKGVAYIGYELAGPALGKVFFSFENINMNIDSHNEPVEYFVERV